MRCRKRIATTIWRTACLPAYRDFYRSTLSLESSQANRLKTILQDNVNSSFGKRYSFSTIHSVTEYQSHVPLSSYEDYEEHIKAIQDGDTSSLTTSATQRLHLTSGSTSSQKFIPFNRPLCHDFQKAIRAWLFDLFSAYPEAFTGRSYWYLTPSFSNVKTPESKVPIAYDQDEQYFSFWEKLLLRELLLSSYTDQTEEHLSFKTQHACSLLHCSDLSFISLWNPSLFTQLLKWIDSNIDHVIRALREKSDPVRAATIISIWASVDTPSKRWPLVWPALSLISCWTEAFAARDAQELQTLLPDVSMQGKGLLATEGVVSIPLADGKPPVLSGNVHFYEFLDVQSGSIYLAHELKRETVYEVIISTSGGLYRYRLGDLVTVEGFLHEAPRLRFQRKVATTVDLRGEKLSESFVRNAVSQSFELPGNQSQFWFVAPWRTCSNAGYSLFTDSKLDTSELALLLSDIEHTLVSNPHYSLCRKQQQLLPLEIVRLNSHGRDAYLEYKQLNGGRGTVKDKCLEPDLHWKENLKEHVIEELSL